MDGTPWLSPSNIKSLLKVCLVSSLLRRVALLLLPLACLAAPADFKAASGYGTRITGGSPIQPVFPAIYPGLDGPFFDPAESEIALEGIALAGEVNEGNGFTRLAFTLRLKNNGPGYYQEVFIEWEPPVDEWRGVRVPDAHGFMPDLVPNGTTSRPQAFEVRVPTADRAAAVAEILAGKRMRPVGIELFQFKQVPMAVDEATDRAYTTHNIDRLTGLIGVTFSSNTALLTALRPGMILVESPYFYTLRRPRMAEANPPPYLSAVVAAAEASGETTNGVPRPTLILEVVSVVAQGSGVLLTGRAADFGNLLDVGSYYQRAADALDPDGATPLRDIYRPPFGSNSVSVFHRQDVGDPPLFQPPPLPKVREARRLTLQGHHSGKFAFGSIYVPFNDVELAPGIKLDGEALLDALNIEFKFRFRGLLQPKVSIKLATKAELTLRLSARARSSNKGPLLQKERSLFSIPVVSIAFAIGPVPVTITPVFQGRVGAEIDAPTECVIPVHGSYEAGVVMTWDGSKPLGQQYSSRPFQKTQPLTVSDPLLHDSLAFTATAFAEMGVDVQVTAGAVPTPGPYFGARFAATFELNPAKTPWWSLDFDLQPVSEFRLRLLGFDLNGAGRTLSDVVRLPRRDAGAGVPRGSGAPGGGGVPPGSFDPVSGGETRWARTAGLNAGGMKVARVSGTAEDVFALTEALVVSPPIMRIGAKGDLLWAKGASLVAPQRLAATADGGCVLVTGGSESLVVWLDGAGNPIAARTFQPQTADGVRQVFYIGALLATPAGETYVLGSVARANFGNDVFIVKYDATRTLVYFRRYSSPTLLDAVTGAALHPSGDLIVCGTSDGAPAGNFPVGRATTFGGGLLMRVRPDGGLTWARRTLTPIVYNAVDVARDGTIFTAGRFLRTVTLDWPALLVARHESARGELEAMVTYGEAMPNLSPFRRPTVPGVNDDYLPEAGLTPFDEANSIAWTPNGLIVAGNTAALPNVNTRAPLVLCLTERLSVRWWTIHEGPGDDAIFNLVPTAQGIFAAGYTRALGAAPNGDAAPALFTKLPMEGKIDFGTALNSKYLVPSVFAVPAFDAVYSGLPTPPQGYLGNETLELSVVAQEHVASVVTPPTFSNVTIDYSAPRQRDSRDANPAPLFTTQPATQAVAAGTTVTFTVAAIGSPTPTLQWQKNTVAIPGQTGASLVLPNVQAADAASYRCVATNSAGTATSSAATLTVNAPPAGVPASRISNVSVRTTLAAAQTLIVGFTMQGGGKLVLLRAVGPGLAVFGVPGTMADPRVQLYKGTTLVTQNDDWGGGAVLSAAFTGVGAFPLTATSRDAALVSNIEGGHTAQISGPAAGTVLVEAYDAGNGTVPRLSNVSARNFVGTGTNILIAGITVAGTAPKNLLIRAAGPALAGFGVPGALADPKLTIYNAAGAIVAENDDWNASLAGTFVSVGAFAFTAGSKDAALTIALAPGGYTAQVSGVTGTGEAIVELYELP